MFLWRNNKKTSPNVPPDNSSEFADSILKDIISPTPCTYSLNLSGIEFVCVEVLWPSQPKWVMSSGDSLPDHAVSFPDHTFTGQT